MADQQYVRCFEELGNKLRELTESLDRGERNLEDVGKAIRRAIRSGAFPDEIAEPIRGASRELSRRNDADEIAVAVRSSATAEDLPEPSFAGFSIGSNDLTQLVLGVDRDSEALSELFDERNEAVKRAIVQVIDKAHRAGVEVGICGQAPCDYPDFARLLIECNNDSISLNPDSVVDIIQQLGALSAGGETKRQAGAGAQ